MLWSAVDRGEALERGGRGEEEGLGGRMEERGEQEQEPILRRRRKREGRRWKGRRRKGGD